MQVVCMKVVTNSSVAIPKFFWEGQILWLKASNGILFGHCLSKHKMARYVRNLGGMVPLPPWLRLWLQEQNENERTVLSWYSIFQTKSSQQRKTARHCRTPTKSNIVSIGCYVCLLSTRLPANRDCLLKLYTPMLGKSARTVSREFYLEKVSTLGLLHMVSWGCCDNTLLCKACFHAVYHQSKED